MSLEPLLPECSVDPATLNSMSSYLSRYIRRRTAGLLVSLREQKETALQKLVKEIEEKSVAEMDSLNKLQMRYEQYFWCRDSNLIVIIIQSSAFSTKSVE